MLLKLTFRKENIPLIFLPERTRYNALELAKLSSSGRHKQELTEATTEI